jgi:hypothetical protein
MQKKILDYEEMIDILNNMVGENIKEEEPIGKTTFGYDIKHYTYGVGEYHVILTAGTHSVELITNCFILKLMEYLNTNPSVIDKNKYTIHFLPIVNPEGTIIVTSAIRTLIPRNIDPFDEQMVCLQYYMNAKLEDKYATEYSDENIKLQHWMFRYADVNCIDDKHAELKHSIENIIKESELPLGILASWGSNGNGIDLNSNVDTGKYFNEVFNDIPNYSELRMNTINKSRRGPIGCPTGKDGFKYENENISLIKFYDDLIKNNKVIGSLIYHSCGGLVGYLDMEEMRNPWNDKYDKQKFVYNKNVAVKYAELSGYELFKNGGYTTMDAKLKSMLPGTLLIELAHIRANPLSQFLDLKNNIYTDTINKNIDILKPVLEEMENQYNLYNK